MVTSYQITEWQKQRKIKKLVWDMACSASDKRVSPFITKEYDYLIELGFMFLYYKQEFEWISYMTNEEQIMFTLFIYHSL